MPPEQTKLYHYCSALYARMDDEAVVEEGFRVWRGRIVQTCIDVGIPKGTYIKVVTKLRSVGCVEQVNRGFRGASLATFILREPPTEDRLESKPDLTENPSYDMLLAQVEDLKRQLGGLNVVSALHNFEQRLQKVERKTRNL